MKGILMTSDIITRFDGNNQGFFLIIRRDNNRLPSRFKDLVAIGEKLKHLRCVARRGLDFRRIALKWRYWWQKKIEKPLTLAQAGTERLKGITSLIPLSSPQLTSYPLNCEYYQEKYKMQVKEG